jgi:hypothetical protein
MVARRSPMVAAFSGDDDDRENRKNLVLAVGRGDDFVLRIENDGLSTQ